MTITKVTDSVRDTVGVAKGGTGLTAVGASGNVLTSNGSAWASTAPAGGGAWNFISSGTASNSSSIDFTNNINSTYDQYVVMGTSIVQQNDGQRLYLRFSTDSGSSWESSSYRHHSNRSSDSSSSYEFEVSTSDGEIHILIFGGNDTGESGNFRCYISNPASASLYTIANHSGGLIDSSGSARVMGGTGYWGGSQSAVNGFRFVPSGGNITSGTFRLYGISNS